MLFLSFDELARGEQQIHENSNEADEKRETSEWQRWTSDLCVEGGGVLREWGVLRGGGGGEGLQRLQNLKTFVCRSTISKEKRLANIL